MFDCLRRNKRPTIECPEPMWQYTTTTYVPPTPPPGSPPNPSEPQRPVAPRLVRGVRPRFRIQDALDWRCKILPQYADNDPTRIVYLVIPEYRANHTKPWKNDRNSPLVIGDGIWYTANSAAEAKRKANEFLDTIVVEQPKLPREFYA